MGYINFTKTNDAPTITSGSSGSVNENLATSTVIYDGNASDLDSSDTLSFSISGTDASFLTVDTNDGEVRLKTSADYVLSERINLQLFYDRMVKKYEVANSYDTANSSFGLKLRFSFGS